MRLAFTGSQRGMHGRQIDTVLDRLQSLLPSEVYHGGCIGADAEFHQLCARIGVPTIVIYPQSKQPSKRAQNLERGRANLLLIETPNPDPLERNHRMVNRAQLVLATPWEMEETLRSGTWATIRYARKTGVPVEIIYP